MFTNVNLAAPVGIVGFLGTGLLFAVLLLTFLISLAARKLFLTRLTFGAMAGIGVAYLATMLLFSFSSNNAVLARGQEKHFCEVDCHLAYSVVDVRQTKTLGSAATQKNAAGTFTVVTIKTRFDETTISATRGNSPLYPNPRLVTMIDQTGHQYSPSPDGQNALEQSTGGGTPITTPLRPGDSYTTTFVFDLPAEITRPVLLINESDWITHFIIGHENSLLHKKTSFQI